MNLTRTSAVDSNATPAARGELLPARTPDPEVMNAPVSDAPALEVQHLSAWYGPRKAIEDVTLPILERHITAIIGPSGCGKSTMIRCLNRMHEVVRGARAEGVVTLGGHNVYDADVDPVDLRRHIGMVFQKPNPFPTMSIFDNVVAGLRLQGGWNTRALDEVAERSLRQAALFDEVKDVWKKATGASLSGGQQQRLCIARTLAVEPRVILMDEPCSALDPIATYRIEELMNELKAQYTIAIVTHNMQQASRVSEFTAFMLAEEDRVGRL
ncbi:MAG: phosphate ABC transporter ATP-binding protein, partial [Chloroflexi bacterium]|nr:phosphate ABC transporter ATP-binding protein [Chloroflexota bacterium]